MNSNIVVSVVWLGIGRERRSCGWRRSRHPKDLRVGPHVLPSSVSSQEVASEAQHQTQQNERQRDHHHHTHLSDSERGTKPRECVNVTLKVSDSAIFKWYCGVKGGDALNVQLVTVIFHVGWGPPHHMPFLTNHSLSKLKGSESDALKVGILFFFFLTR